MIGIECCHPTADGKFNDNTFNSLIELVADLCKRFKLDPIKDVYRHYDVCGKSCPLFYVKNSNEWTSLKNKIKAKYDQGTVKQAAPVTKDSNVPSDWAIKAWEWAKANDFNDGTRPTEKATREEVTAILFKVYQSMQKSK
jgi:N-acetylmuramoyl-L-alanine amidase